MGLFITIGVAAVSFIAGALVFRNNSAKFEPIVQKGKEELADAKAEIEKLKESIKQLIETQHPTSP